MTSDQSPLVIFHAPCRDGFTAAWVAWRYFVDRAKDVGRAGQVAEFFPAAYGDSPPGDRLVEGRDVYILDFSYSRDQILDMAEHAMSVTVLDHHETAADELGALAIYCPHNVRLVFDMDKSGARLAWEHFNPMQAAPALVQYVEDRDLWRFELEGSEEINAYIASQELSFGRWQDLTYELSVTEYWERAFETGSLLVAAMAADVEKALDFAATGRISGHEVLFVNSCLHVSEIGEALRVATCDFAAIWWFDGAKVRVSLRGRDNGPAVNKVAEQFGGGGHRNAAGFSTDFETLQMFLSRK